LKYPAFGVGQRSGKVINFMPKKIKKTKKNTKKASKRIVKKAKTSKKKTTRKVAKKTIKKVSRNSAAKKVAKKTTKKRAVLVKTTKGPKAIGTVTHFYDGLGVAIVKFSKAMAIGTPLKFKGATTDFEDKIISMQFDRKPITLARKNLEVGIKVRDKVREGDKVFEV